MEQTIDGVHRSNGNTLVIFQPDFHLQMGQFLELPPAVVAQDTVNTVGQRGVEPFWQRRCIHSGLRLGQFKIQQFAPAGRAHGKGQGQGNKGMGIESLGVLQQDAAAAERPLQNPHQIQMGNPDAVAGLFK